MNFKKRVSSKDVAKEAGVSQATVSYVLNNKKEISIKPETREAVIEAAKKLNYHPNLIAKSMKINKSMSIGIVTDKEVLNQAFMNTLEGIKDALIEKNYSITLCLNKSDDFVNSEHIIYYNSNRIDGIIFVFADLTDQHITYLSENNIPFVIINSLIKNEIIHVVRTDMSHAIIDGIGELKKKKINQVGYLGTSTGNVSNRRYECYLNALNYHEIPFNKSLTAKYSRSEEEFVSFFDRFFQSLNFIPRALICDSPDLAFHLIKYCTVKKIDVPDKLAVIAIGTSQFSPLAQPSLSAIEAPLYEMGYTGCIMLFDVMENKSVKDVVVLEWKFQRRDSV